MGAERDKTVDELLQAREAYERRDWALALDRLRGVGQLGPRTPSRWRPLPTSWVTSMRRYVPCSPGTRT